MVLEVHVLPNFTWWFENVAVAFCSFWFVLYNTK